MLLQGCRRFLKIVFCIATLMLNFGLCQSQTQSIWNYNGDKQRKTYYTKNGLDNKTTIHGTPQIKYRKPALAHYKTLNEPKPYRMSVTTSLTSSFRTTVSKTQPVRVRRSQGFIDDPSPTDPADPLPSDPFIDDPDPDNPADPLPTDPFIDDPDPNNPADPLANTPIGDCQWLFWCIMCIISAFFKKKHFLAHLL